MEREEGPTANYLIRVLGKPDQQELFWEAVKGRGFDPGVLKQGMKIMSPGLVKERTEEMFKGGLRVNGAILPGENGNSWLHLIEGLIDDEAFDLLGKVGLVVRGGENFELLRLDQNNDQGNGVRVKGVGSLRYEDWAAVGLLPFGILQSVLRGSILVISPSIRNPGKRRYNKLIPGAGSVLLDNIKEEAARELISENPQKLIFLFFGKITS